MELNFLSFKKQYIKWTTRIPRLNSTFNSPPMFLDGFRWLFEFQTLKNMMWTEEAWVFFFRRRHMKKANPNKYLLAVLARNRRGTFENICSETIGVDTTDDELIFMNKRSSFVSKHPNLDLSGDTLTLMFVFDQGIRNLADHQEIAENEHKSVQTSSSLVVQPCLENLSRDLHKLLGEDSTPDVQLRCGDCIFPAHRLILSARSEVFREMLQKNLPEGQESSIEIINLEPSIFEPFLLYLYTGTLPELTVDTASPLYEAGDKYHLEVLRKRCSDFLSENLALDNACEILVMADAHADKDLKERVVSFVVDEEFPDKEDDWAKFSDAHPRLSNEVLYRAYRRIKSSK